MNRHTLLLLIQLALYWQKFIVLEMDVPEWTQPYYGHQN